MTRELPPQNIEAELAVISSAIINKDSLEKVIEYGQHIYYMENSRKAWKILKQLYNLEMDTGYVIFKDIAVKQENIPEDYISDLYMSDVIGSQVDSLLRELTSRWREREVIRLTAS
jgi:replicative DNA helicase